jgi:hypothetical protein
MVGRNPYHRVRRAPAPSPTATSDNSHTELHPQTPTAMQEADRAPSLPARSNRNNQATAHTTPAAGRQGTKSHALRRRIQRTVAADQVALVGRKVAWRCNSRRAAVVQIRMLPPSSEVADRRASTMATAATARMVAQVGRAARVWERRGRSRRMGGRFFIIVSSLTQAHTTLKLKSFC